MRPRADLNARGRESANPAFSRTLSVRRGLLAGACVLGLLYPSVEAVAGTNTGWKVKSVAETGFEYNTNVYKTFNLILDRSARQVSFYDKGLGTGWRKLTGNAAGRGFSKKPCLTVRRRRIHMMKRED